MVVYVTWTLFIQAVGSLGFPILAIACFAIWYSKREDKREEINNKRFDQQRKDDIKRDAEYRQDCKEREARLNELVKETNATNTYILKANDEILSSNRILMDDYKKDLSIIKHDVTDIKNELKIKLENRK